MEILRIASTTPQAVITVTDPSTEYGYSILDLSDRTVTSGNVTSNSSSEVTISFSTSYDSEYQVTIDGSEHYYSVVRPYVDPNTLGSTEAEIAEYTLHEELARAIVDAVVPEGFYYRKKIVDTVGLGGDYLPLWVNAKKLLKLYENNVLVYDSSDLESYTTMYKLTDDKTAITTDYDGMINKSEGTQLVLPQAMSDLWDMKFGYRGFANSFDYTLVLEVGYKSLPSDIKRAVSLMIDDIKCDRLNYAGRYIKDYNTDQFKIKFDDKVFEGTGNLIVDKILSKYAKSIRTVGVL